jgi:hypothetical protein
MQRDDVLVAEKALLHIGYSCPGGSFREGMTEKAAYLFDSGMNPVAEINRLLYPCSLLGKDVEKVKGTAD